ncbi:unnamed protein product [Ixodes hexagonus]
MVKIKVKCNFDIQFLVESPLTTGLSELLPELVCVYNGILTIRSAIDNLEELTKHLESNAASHAHMTVEQLPPMEVELSNGHVLSKVAAEARARVSKEQLESGICITKDLIASTKEMFTNTFSVLKLPEETSQFERAVLESLDSADVEGSLQDGDARLWWAGRELTRDKKLRDFVGSNEKTTIIATLSSSAVIHQTRVTSEASRDFLLARLERENELDYLEAEDGTSPRDTRTLQKSVHGLSEVRWKL